MESSTPESCCPGNEAAQTSGAQTAGSSHPTDPVCGMFVEPDSAKATIEHDGSQYYFCCADCLRKFVASPETFLKPPAMTPPTGQPTSAVIAGTYTCPMHPKVITNRPGDCPDCGMPLESVIPTADDGAAELEEISDRLRWSALFSIPVLVLAWAHMLAMAKMAQPDSSHLVGLWLQCLLASPVALVFARPFFNKGWASLKTRRLNMFTLLSLGIAIPYVYSLLSLLVMTFSRRGAAVNHMVYFESSAVIATLAWFGQFLEAKARARSASAVRELIALAPAEATVVFSDGTEGLVPVADIALHARIRVHPGERVPVDGRVIEGTSFVDESMLTGEPVETTKLPGSNVSAGTLNRNGSLLIDAEKVGDDTLLSQIVSLVSTAQRSRVPVQQLADKVASIFVPAVIACAVATIMGWLCAGATLVQALSCGVAVLVVACPCALGLATPMSISVAAGRAARAGVLFKEARSLELLAGVDTLIVDKTGTLTFGTPQVVRISSAGKLSDEELLSLAGSVESLSEHPLAAAIVDACKERSVAVPSCTHFDSVPGLGVNGVVSGRRIAIGSQGYLHSLGVDSSSLGAVSSSFSSIFVSVDGNCEGRIDLADELRPSSASAVADLQARGVRVIIASGDTMAAVQTAAIALGIAEIHAGLLPADKSDLIRKLQSQGAKVAMAGDGINDAPALAQANVGIAMASGCDIAVDTADIVLVHSDITGIVRALKVSKAMLRNIAQNLFLAFAYNLLAIPVAAGLLVPVIGFAVNPMIAAAAMSVSSVSVIANALRLRSIRL